MFLLLLLLSVSRARCPQMHAVWSGVRYSASHGSSSSGLYIDSLDAAMACPLTAQWNFTSGELIGDGTDRPCDTNGLNGPNGQQQLNRSCPTAQVDPKKGQRHCCPTAHSCRSFGVGGMALQLHANRMGISGFPQWYPFGIKSSHPLLKPGSYQKADENMLYRVVIREQKQNSTADGVNIKTDDLFSTDVHGSGTPTTTARPSAAQLQLMNMGLAQFMHFSVDTFTDGVEHNCVGERKDCIPATAFNPTHLDTDQWVQAALKMGAGEICLTAHHEGGFCLWDTKFSNYSVMHSPFGKDVVKMFVSSCRKFGVRPCFYMGPNANGFLANNQSYSTKRFVEAQLGMVTELLTNYGHISRLWWDHYASSVGLTWGACGPHSGGAACPIEDNVSSFPAAYPQFVALVRKLSPKTIICPGPDCDGHRGEDGVGQYPTWLECSPDTNSTWLALNSTRTLQLCKQHKHYPNDTLKLFHPFETCATLRAGHKWFCEKGGCKRASDFWSGRAIWDHYMASVSVGWVSTLNAPPTTSGLIAAPLVAAMTQFGDALRALLRPVSPAAVIFNVTLDCGASAAAATLDLGDLTTFNAVMSREDMSTTGQRVREYEVQFEDPDESGSWRTFALGSSGIGPPVTPVGQCSARLNNTNLVTGGNSSNAHCIGLTETAAACAQKCLANATCHFYTWHDKNQGPFQHKCFLRFDDCFSGHQQDGHYSGVCNHTGSKGTVPLRSSCGDEWTPIFGTGIHGASIGARMIDFVPLTTARKVRLRCTAALEGAPASARLSSFSVHRGEPPPQPDPLQSADDARVRLKTDEQLGHPTFETPAVEDDTVMQFRIECGSISRGYSAERPHKTDDDLPCRDRFLSPFGAKSLWNVAIGADAKFVPANIYALASTQLEEHGPGPSKAKCANMTAHFTQRHQCPGAHSGITAAQCAQKGCCFSRLHCTVPCPWCFTPTQVAGPASFHNDADHVIHVKAADPVVTWAPELWGKEWVLRVRDWPSQNGVFGFG